MLHSISSKSLVLPYGKYRGWPTPLPPTPNPCRPLGAPFCGSVCVGLAPFWPFFRGRNRKKHLIIIDRIQDGPKSAQDAPREPQDRLKIAQDGPKSPQDGPKIGPDGPKIPQDGPKTPPEGPKIASRSPKMAPRAPKTAPRSAKMAPRSPKMPQDLPRRPKDRSKRSPRRSQEIPNNPEDSRVTPRWTLARHNPHAEDPCEGAAVFARRAS